MGAFQIQVYGFAITATSSMKARFNNISLLNIKVQAKVFISKLCIDMFLSTLNMKMTVF
jgi:hypothetical protein